MATLLDTLKKNLGQVTSPEAVADETGTVRELLAAKKGIVGPATALGPRGLSIAEAAARAPAQQELAQTAQTAQMQATAIGQAAAGQEEEERQKTEQIALQRQQNQLQNKIQTENVLRGLEQNRAALTEDQRRAGMEQVAAQLRLQNTAYVDTLQREGNKSRLKDAIAFDAQLKQDVFNENQALLKLKYKNEAALDADARSFNRAMAELSIEQAWQLARENSRMAQRQADIKTVGSLVTTGIGAAGKAYEGGFDSDYRAYLDNLGPGERPISYTKWQETEGLKSAKGNLPAYYKPGEV